MRLKTYLPVLASFLLAFSGIAVPPAAHGDEVPFDSLDGSLFVRKQATIYASRSTASAKRATVARGCFLDYRAPVDEDESDAFGYKRWFRVTGYYCPSSGTPEAWQDVDGFVRKSEAAVVTGDGNIKYDGSFEIRECPSTACKILFTLKDAENEDCSFDYISHLNGRPVKSDWLIVSVDYCLKKRPINLIGFYFNRKFLDLQEK